MSQPRIRISKQWLILTSLAILAISIWARVLTVEPDSLRIVFLDVGQGDCIYMRTPSGKTVMVDGGGRANDNGSEIIGSRVVEPFLRHMGVNRIDLIVLTHPHDDHLQGLIPVIRDFRIGMVLDPELPFDSENYSRFKNILKKRRIDHRRAVRGQIIDIGDGVMIYVLHPPNPRLAGTEEDVNNNSVVLRITYEDHSILLTGDAEMEAEEDILRSGINVKSEILKSGHHGSDTGTTEEWLDAVQPKSVIISVGKNNPFGHPSREVLERLRNRGIQIYRTDKDGAVSIEIEEDKFEIKGVKNSYSVKRRESDKQKILPKILIRK